MSELFIRSKRILLVGCISLFFHSSAHAVVGAVVSAGVSHAITTSGTAGCGISNAKNFTFKNNTSDTVSIKSGGPSVLQNCKGVMTGQSCHFCAQEGVRLKFYYSKAAHKDTDKVTTNFDKRSMKCSGSSIGRKLKCSAN